MTAEEFNVDYEVTLGELRAAAVRLSELANSPHPDRCIRVDQLACARALVAVLEVPKP